MQPDHPLPRIIIIGGIPANYAKIHARFLTAGYKLKQVKDADDLLSFAPDSKSIDALMIFDRSAMAFLREFIGRTLSDKVPPIILFDDGDTDFEELKIPVDCVLSSLNPVVASKQLQMFVALKRSLAEKDRQILEQQNDLARRKKEYEDVFAEMEQQRFNTNAIEILKNAIVRSVSHELKTPLLQVKSAVSLIAEDAKDVTLVDYAKNATARLETLVRNITMLGSSLDINPGPVIVRDAIEYARRNLSRVWLYRGESERIRVEIEDNLPPVYADRQGLSTVLQLLTDNALKFSDSIIKIRARRSGDLVEISVCDDGIGIEPNQLEAIFDSFYQIDNSSNRRYGGTGVGLAIVKLILDNHDVEINVQSELERGSAFSFKLKAINL